MKNILYISLFLLGLQQVSAQHFTRKDTLQGGLRHERTSFDVQRYDLNIKINPEERTIIGYNDITFKIAEPTKKIQIDLFDNMKVDSIVFNMKKLQYKRDHHAVFINFNEMMQPGTEGKIRFYYSGKPLVARNAPWDGGFVFKKDTQDKPWIGVAVQGTGASLWYPVKDSQSDEPDFGSSVKVAVPNGLMNVSNGRFLGSEDLKNGYTRWDWEVKSPINTYNITVNIADYVHIHDTYKGLDLDYYVLRANEEKARKHFEADVKPMMDCFQSKFGTYPFKEDGYKLVETPYLGMEHQSAVAYGNKYMKGYLGNDLSFTGVGLAFDYITIHETGHEWFGNSVTSKDIADMWIHEGFTTYSETVFIECTQGYEKAMKYINGQRLNVQNDKPIIGAYGVNNEGSGDMYYKGSLMLNTLRHVLNEDEKWWALILKYSETYRHQIIDTETVVDFFNKESGLNLTPIFNQYLRYKNIPVLEVRQHKKNVQIRWKTDVANFEMPVEYTLDGFVSRINATNNWQSLPKKTNLDKVAFNKTKMFFSISK
ncbi:metalloprotease [Flavobacterium saliperosum S13]|uniref:Peptidase family M1 n=2 Tax=Flavobacterium saliperosum TaxID=329186 RepID=A0A1G4VK70_9FLAO|nr:M1 family metallopeptidase [Flavobacterium saliperosum]ESU25591.1 metalloprotease [Flavobacterium saliperosum S13]SCX07996.1 Peptidase family M1 [Flavobacterium saliperosum]